MVRRLRPVPVTPRPLAIIGAVSAARASTSSAKSAPARNGADSAGRARALLDEIRRRSGDLQRPQIELDYLRRLLDLF